MGTHFPPKPSSSSSSCTKAMDSLGGDWELLDFYGDPTPRSNNTFQFQFDDYFSPNNSNNLSIHTTHLLPVPIVTIGDAPPELTKLPIDSTINNQAFFLKMKETDQFVDMKMDSPKSPPIGPIPISISPQIDDAEPYQNAISPRTNKTDPDGNNAISPRTSKADPDPTVAEEEIGGGEKVWKWSFTGIGALCSFGAAVATVCIMNLGNHQKHKARFQIYASEKRIKQVLDQATRLNEVMAGSTGVQLGRAHISYGGHYDSV